jgi:outer membrane protein OmpA-like peptidoglycan-associated protein
MWALRLLMLAAVAAAAAACAPQQELFVVFPNADGSSGAITVSDHGRSTTLDRPYAAAEVRSDALARSPTAPGDAQLTFRSAFYSRPIPPHHFRLYFATGTSQLTPASVQAYHAVFDDIHQRPAYQIEVIGHTDTVGAQAYNQALSLQRAAAIRDRLTRDGIAPQAISIAGRGKLDLLVPTADQVVGGLGVTDEARDIGKDGVDGCGRAVRRRRGQRPRQSLGRIERAFGVGRLGHPVGVEQQRFAGLEPVAVDREGKVADRAERRPAVGGELARCRAGAQHER